MGSSERRQLRCERGEYGVSACSSTGWRGGGGGGRGRGGTHHLVDELDGAGEAVCLEADALVAVEELLERVLVVEVGALDAGAVVVLGLDEDVGLCLVGGRGRRCRCGGRGGSGGRGHGVLRRREEEEGGGEGRKAKASREAGAVQRGRGGVLECCERVRGWSGAAEPSAEAGGGAQQVDLASSEASAGFSAEMATRAPPRPAGRTRSSLVLVLSRLAAHTGSPSRPCACIYHTRTDPPHRRTLPTSPRGSSSPRPPRLISRRVSPSLHSSLTRSRLCSQGRHVRPQGRLQGDEPRRHRQRPLPRRRQRHLLQPPAHGRRPLRPLRPEPLCPLRLVPHRLRPPPCRHGRPDHDRLLDAPEPRQLPRARRGHLPGQGPRALHHHHRPGPQGAVLGPEEDPDAGLLRQLLCR